MKKLLILSPQKALLFGIGMIVLVITLCAALFGGCAGLASSSSPAASSSAQGASSPSLTPIPTTPPDTTPDDSALSGDESDETKSITYNGWTYYLDVNASVVVNFNEDPPLNMKNADGSTNQELGIRGFEFDIIGNYIYVDSNDPDLSANGTQTWSTTRMNADGSNKKELEYGSMSLLLVPQGEQKFYFTTLGDSAIYISDFSCENVTTLIVGLPDRSELDQKLDKNKVLQLSITEVANGAINFEATFSSEDGTALYNGSYKITVDGKSIEKIKGTYYYYSSQNESD